ncbi:MAG: cyclodeaminase/cyclohydrolase family protein [Mediterranea sp.]|jgi:formiminotetrahydrofolate cyclodeaminase|nr:cyclodeaminase/cyclohydrolase family protein [Mediterranea sp.]
MLANLTIREFLCKTAGNEPVPGGGSISALNGAIALALTEMVANLTIGKKKYVNVEEEMRSIVITIAPVRERLVEYIDADSDAYNRVFEAFKLPKDTDEQAALRAQAVEQATQEAAHIPMKVAEETCSLMDLIAAVAEKGNQNAVTDATVAMMAARTAVLGALLNVRINLSSIKDEAFVKEMSDKANLLERTAIAKEQRLLNEIKDRL